MPSLKHTQLSLRPVASSDTAPLRIGAFYAALFLILGLHITYLPLWLDWAGLTAFQIALVSAVPLFLRLGFAPVVALYADRFHAYREMILVLAAAAFMTGAVLIGIRGFWPIFLFSMVFTLAIATIMPLVETIAVARVKAKGHDYGRMRLWGSLSFVAVGFVGGALIDWAGAGIVLPLLLIAIALTFAAGLALPKASSRSDVGAAAANVPGEPRVEDASAPRLDQNVLRQLLSCGLFLVFLIAGSATQGAHGLFYTFGALHWKSQGLSTTVIGMLWAIGVVAEVILFAWSGAVVRRVGAVTLMILGGAAGVVRWLAMCFDPGLVWLVPLQILHGATYGATHIGAIYFLARSIPERASGTAQALYGACAMGVATGGATLISGPLYDHFAGQGYFVMAIFSAVGLLAALLLSVKWTGGLLWDAKTGGPDEADQELGPQLPVGPNI